MKCPKCKGKMEETMQDGTSCFICIKCLKYVYFDSGELHIATFEINREEE